MAVDTFPTACDPRLNFGVDCADLVLVGHSLTREIGWDTPVIDPETGKETCAWAPADFTDYVPEAVVLDSANQVVATFEVTPAVGDDTGTFSLFLDASEITEALRAVAVRWRFSVDSVPTREPLVYAQFKVT